MPTYENTNTTDVAICQPPYTFTIQAGGTLETKFYIRSLPDGVTLSSHSPITKPWTLLATVSSFPSSDIDVFAYPSVVVYNGSNGNVSMSANGDDSNAIILAPTSKEVYNNTNGTFGFLTILTNSGTGNVYIWGTK